MSFIADLAKIAQPVARPIAVNRKDPVQGMRVKFAVFADGQISKIKAAADKDRWFSKTPEGDYVLCLRNANKALAVGGNTHFQVKDAAAAVQFLETAKKAVAAGELDEALKETAFKRKEKPADANAEAGKSNAPAANADKGGSKKK